MFHLQHSNYRYGLQKGISIGLGYLAVSFAFGVMAASGGMTPLCATMISLTNVTSAGQFAGVKLIWQCASYVEIFSTVLLINLRYALMSFAISQKLDSQMPWWQRLIVGYGMTDEIFAVAIREERKTDCSYFLGLMTLPLLGWTVGTWIGSVGAGIFSANLLTALNISLYAMFIAIITPDAKKNYKVALVIAVSLALSCIFEYVYVFDVLGVGFKIIISAVIAAGVGSFLFPLPKEAE